MWYIRINVIYIKADAMIFVVFDCAQNGQRKLISDTYIYIYINVYSTEFSISVTNRKQTTGDSNAMRFALQLFITSSISSICQLFSYCILSPSLSLFLSPSFHFSISNPRNDRRYSIWLFDCVLHALYLNLGQTIALSGHFLLLSFFFNFFLFYSKAREFSTKTQMKYTVCLNCATCEVADL